MPTLSPNEHVLSGGCFCKAITYTITVPALTSRPLIPKSARYPIKTYSDADPERLPVISLDHCTSCRHITGSIVHGWFICPQSWIQFSLLPRATSTAPSSVDATKADKPTPAITPSSTIDVLHPSQELLDTSYLSHFSSSEDIHRTFCGRCGTSLSYCSVDSNENVARWGPYCDITLGTLDDGCLGGVMPTRYVWLEEGVEWVKSLCKVGEESLRV